MKQKQVKLLSFTAENHRVIKAVTLTPDLLEQKLIQLVGDIGNGKSSLLETLQIALSGSDAIKKKDALEKGFLAEVQLLDGDIKLYAGSRVTEYKRGNNQGEPKFEIFLYAKDDEGKTYTPIIDGKKATASDYAKILTTELTFNMPDLFSSNATTHRKLIEKLFAEEIENLGVEELNLEIAEQKKKRDYRRNICDSTGAFMDAFKEEGYNEESLRMLERVDTQSLDKEITKLEFEKTNLKFTIEKEVEVQNAQFNEQKTKNLSAIKDSIQSNTEKIKAINEQKINAYNQQQQAKIEYDSKIHKIESEKYVFLEDIDKKNYLTDDFILSIKQSIIKFYDDLVLSIEQPTEPKEIKTIPIENSKVVIPESYDPEYENLVIERKKLISEYLSEDKKEFVANLAGVNQEEIDKKEKEIDSKIATLSIKKQSANGVNSLIERFNNWEEWMKEKSIYENLLEQLRQTYAKIDTGVDGLRVVPNITNSGTELWLKYNGVFDKEFFGNETLEERYLFDYSFSQRGVLGVILQASRLDKKPKALRLAILDDVPMTQKGIDVLLKICNERNIQLITSRTDDRYDKDKIDDGSIIIEGGEVFFNKN